MADLFRSFGDSLPPVGLYHRVLRDLEVPLIAATLSATRGNQIKAAEILGLNRNTLRKKIRDLDLTGRCADLNESRRHFVAILQQSCKCATLEFASARRNDGEIRQRDNLNRNGQRDTERVACAGRGSTSVGFPACSVRSRSAAALILALATFVIFAGFTPIIPTQASS